MTNRIEVSDEELIELWYSNVVAKDICRDMGWSEGFLSNHWTRLKKKGELPRHFRATVSRSVREHGLPSHRELLLGDEFVVSDGRPRVGMRGRDALLDALRGEHGESRPDLHPGAK